MFYTIVNCKAKIKNRPTVAAGGLDHALLFPTTFTSESEGLGTFDMRSSFDYPPPPFEADLCLFFPTNFFVYYTDFPSPFFLTLDCEFFSGPFLFFSSSFLVEDCISTSCWPLLASDSLLNCSEYCLPSFSYSSVSIETC